MVFQKIKKFFSDFYNVYLTGLTVLVALPILAPVLLKLGLEQVAKIIYFIYSFFCHQFAYRSIHLFDYQLAWCARDTGIWLGILIAALLIKLNKIKGIKWYWILPFLIPIALDGGLQTVFTILNISSKGVLIGLPLYMSTNLTRFMTGAVFGIGLSLWLSPMIREDAGIAQKPSELIETSQSSLKNLLKTNAAKILAVCFFMLPVYIVFFSFWNFTSEEHKPDTPLDFVVKAPQQDFMLRREDGVCPTSGFEDFLALDCFL